MSKTGIYFDQDAMLWMSNYGELDQTHYRKSVLKYLNQLDPYFRLAKKKDEFSFMLLFLSFKSDKPNNFDALLTAREIRFATEHINKKYSTWKNIRYHYDLFNYGLICENDEFYVLVYSLLRILDEEEFSANPFFQLTKDKSKAVYQKNEIEKLYSFIESNDLPKLPSYISSMLEGSKEKELYPINKIEEIHKLSKHLKMPKITFYDFYDNNLRNSIFHSKYMIDGNNADIIVNEKFNKLITLDSKTILDRINEANAYRDALLHLFDFYKKQYKKSFIIDGTKNFINTKAAVIVKKTEGLIGLKEVTDIEFNRYRIGIFTTEDITLIERGIYDLPKSKNKSAQEIIDKFPRKLQPIVNKFLRKFYI